MSYKVLVDPSCLLDIKRHKQAGNRKLVLKIEHLISELAEHPRTGTGKPEQLKNYTQEIWSRRIDQKHRLIYEIRERELIVIAIAAYGHYND
ncbi:MAG: Txe/YoeB family addiction module toxin [Bacteroidales bacterium]|nr:Txe/YoeB family addiction module toxin [Bacteroidales bacterium]MCL2133171.1 Txe/YoeB family addiction module toxin [Bacteroidales bacterium]